MPRPSLADVRTEELLDAFMRCVARYGVDGSTLERISEEAGVARPMLRHYLGNREQMVDLLFKHVLRKFSEKTDELFASLPQEDRLPVLMTSLFDGHAHQADNASVYQALAATSHRYDGMAEQLLGFVTGFERAITKELAQAYPNADLSQCSIVAAGIVAIYFNHDAAMPLNPPQSWRDRQRASAELLVDSLV